MPIETPLLVTESDQIDNSQIYSPKESVSSNQVTVDPQHSNQAMLKEESEATGSQPLLGSLSITDYPSDFYSKAETYWTGIEPTVDGVLGGLSEFDAIDIRASRTFLTDYYRPNDTTAYGYVLDCGAGIGRVSKQLLLPRFKRVDMVELCREFIDAAPAYIGPTDYQRIGQMFCSSLQDFQPPANRYNVIWVQWVLGHLTDADLIALFKRLTLALDDPGKGMIFVKENVTSSSPDRSKASSILVSSSESIFDPVDSSYIRPREALVAAFQAANLCVVGERSQSHFPRSLFPVRMFALKACDEHPSVQSN